MAPAKNTDVAAYVAGWHAAPQQQQETRMPHAELNGASIWYDDWGGAGEPILLHHGYTASRENWGYDGATAVDPAPDCLPTPQAGTVSRRRTAAGP